MSQESSNSPATRDHQGVESVVRFIRAHGGECLAKLSDEDVRSYLAMRARDVGLFLVRFRGQFVGMLDGKRCTADQMTDPWGGENPHGDCLVFGNFIIHPEFGVEVRRSLIGMMKARWPKWKSLRLHMYRSKYGGIVQVRPRYVDLAVRKWNHEL